MLKISSFKGCRFVPISFSSRKGRWSDEGTRYPSVKNKVFHGSITLFRWGEHKGLLELLEKKGFLEIFAQRRERFRFLLWKRKAAFAEWKGVARERRILVTLVGLKLRVSIPQRESFRSPSERVWKEKVCLKSCSRQRFCFSSEGSSSKL